MNELLKAIEELKRAYRESGAKSVKIELDGGDTKCVEIDNLQQTCNKLDTNLQQKPLTNGEWLRGLSDEELAQYIYNFCDRNCYICKNKNEDCTLAWLRAERKGVDE